MMKKLLLVSLALLFATSALATEVKVSGDYYAEGTYYGNFAFADDDEVNYSGYEHQMNVKVQFVVDPETSAVISAGLRQEDWLDMAKSNDEAAHDTFFPDAGAKVNESGSLDDNIAIEQAYVSHKFPTDTTLVVGLMSGGTWGVGCEGGSIPFGEKLDYFYRVKVNQDLVNGIFTSYIEKRYDAGMLEQTVKDAEKDDGDKYAIGWTGGKFDNVNVNGTLTYVNASNTIADRGSDGTKTVGLDISSSALFELGGKKCGFDAEAIYVDSSKDATATADKVDYSVYGIYYHMFSDVTDMVRIGGWIAYGSVDYDDDNDVYVLNGAFDFGDDFNSGLIYGDEITTDSIVDGIVNDPNVNVGGKDLAGVTAIKLYSDFSINDELSIGGALLYWMDNFDSDLIEFDGMEIDITGVYKITKAMKGYAGIGYATLDVTADDSLGGDPDLGEAMLARVGVSLVF